MTDKPSGGIHWELGEARKEIIAAQIAGDVEAETDGWMHLADALVNAAGSGAAKELTPMLLALREARAEAKQSRAEAKQSHAERQSDAILSERNQEVLIDQAEVVQAEQGRQAARLGLAEASVLALLLALAVSSADRKRHTAEIEALAARVAALELPGEP